MPDEHCSGHQDLVVQLAKGEEHFVSIKEDISEVLDGITGLRKKQNDFERRMFVDNGTPCIQSRLIHLEQHREVAEKHRRHHEKWLMLVGSVILGVAGRVLYLWITT